MGTFSHLTHLTIGMPYHLYVGLSTWPRKRQTNAIDRYCPITLTYLSTQGDLLTGKEAKEMGLITSCVPAEKLEAEVNKFATR